MPLTTRGFTPRKGHGNTGSSRDFSNFSIYDGGIKTVRIQTDQREQILDITRQVREAVEKNGWGSGLLALFCPHTTAAISINENADPDVKRDILYHLKKTIPQSPEFRHFEDNADAHIKSVLTGFSLVVIVEKGEIRLGRWQGLYFCEFDGPKDREIWLKWLPEAGG